MLVVSECNLVFVYPLEIRFTFPQTHIIDIKRIFGNGNKTIKYFEKRIIFDMLGWR